MSPFVGQGIKTVHAGRGEGVKKWQNSVHVNVECSLTHAKKMSDQLNDAILFFYLALEHTICLLDCSATSHFKYDSRLTSTLKYELSANV